MDKNIYLLDDVLSAVDMKVGKHIFKDCIKNFLSNKIVLFISNNDYYCKFADNQISLNKGITSTKNLIREKNNQIEKIENSLKNSDFDSSLLQNDLENNVNIIDEEETKIGSVALKTWRTYYSQTKFWVLLSFVFVSFLVTAFQFSAHLWVKF